MIADGPKNNKIDINNVKKTRALFEKNYKNLKLKFIQKNLGLKKESYLD